MKDLSVEYAHIYTNERISDDHALSLSLLKDIVNGNEQGISLVVMVDDYSFPDPTFDYGEFTKWLTGEGYAPNVVVRESQLTPQCDHVLALIADASVKDPIVDYIKSKKKYPCSLFIAAWYLVRLGALKHPSFANTEVAARLINILPESFRSFEEKAVDILKATPHSTLVEKIENRYFAGRLIA